ncbi:hypothetical protein BDV96DRAFT_608191 [Lophiotrema nucula]|uniref:SnoaL-like domain-containing protein n=1 Tax=Lophiotrema nucula TaxID=690887 RepID=A0A6A5YFK7_9PLEO|nr:hypothetical protein BDV96DRAFT_608191 [Lophiotrema nucula]
MTTKSRAIEITTQNLTLIFGESDALERKQKLEELWFPPNEVLFIDPLGAFKTHEAIEELIVKLLGMDCSSGEDEETDTWVTRLKWGQGPHGGEFKLTGEDVVTIVGGRIQRLYTFLDGSVPS